MAKKEIVKKETYTTTGGKVIELAPVSWLFLQDIKNTIKEEFEEQGEQVETPTYEITTVAGDVELHVLDEDSLEAETDEETERRKEVWEAYQECQKKMCAVEVNRTQDYIFREGVVVDLESEEFQRWKRNSERLHVKVPEDVEDQKFFYVSRWLLRTVEDIMQVVTRVTVISAKGGIDERLVTTVLDSFRDQVERKSKELVEAQAETGDVDA